MYGASMRASDSSTQTFVFDPDTRVREFGQRQLFIITIELEVEFFIRRRV
jgi:hypothetical protein